LSESEKLEKKLRAVQSIKIKPVNYQILQKTLKDTPWGLKSVWTGSDLLHGGYTPIIYRRRNCLLDFIAPSKICNVSWDGYDRSIHEHTKILCTPEHGKLKETVEVMLYLQRQGFNVEFSEWYLICGRYP